MCSLRDFSSLLVPETPINIWLLEFFYQTHVAEYMMVLIYEDIFNFFLNVSLFCLERKKY